MSITPIKQEPTYDLPKSSVATTTTTAPTPTTTTTTTTTDTLTQVKEEDTKDVKIVINQLQDVADELAERPDIDIKLENTAKVEDDLQVARSNKDIYYYSCNHCGEKLMDLRATLLHKQEVHNITTRTKYKHLDVEPNIDDPNNYCATCTKSFSTKDDYWYHLKTLHFIVRVREQILQPNINDPHFYCQACDFTYINQHFYFKHLKSYHKIKIRASDRRASSSSSSKLSAVDLKTPKVIQKKQKRNRICCKECGKELSTRDNYATHAKMVHNISGKSKLSANMVIMPTFEESYQCRGCGNDYNSKQLYLEHLLAVHQMNIDEDSSTPDVNDPNFYCRVCDATSSSHNNFLTHLLAKHDMGAVSSSSSSSSSLLPDINDPNFYCSVCQRDWPSLGPYRQHCRKVHNIKLTSSQRLPVQNAPIDPNDPNSYCAQCNRTYKHYQQHLRQVHNMSFPAPPRPPRPAQ